MPTTTTAPTPTGLVMADCSIIGYTEIDLCGSTKNKDLFEKYGTYLNLKVWDNDGQYWIDNFCEGAWKVRDPTNTGWIDMNWKNTRMRSEDNAVWYRPYCIEESCMASIPPIVTFPTPVTTGPPTSVVTYTSTTVSSIVTVDSISFMSSSKAVAGTTVSSTIDVSYIDIGDFVGKTINTINIDTGYYCIATVGLYNTTSVDVRTLIQLTIVYGTQTLLFNELRYGTANDLVIPTNTKVVWSGSGLLNINNSSGYIITATLTTTVPLDIDINLQVFKKTIL